MRFYEVCNLLDVTISGPYITEKISRMNFAMTTEKVAVSATAEHDVRVEFAAQLVFSFAYDTR